MVRQRPKQRCRGSHDVQMLAWPPDEDGYPGAAVCAYCSKGVLALKGTVRRATSESGYEGYAGKLRVHDFN